MFRLLSKKISLLEQICPLCWYGNANPLGICQVCFNDLPRCPPVNLVPHMCKPPKGIRAAVAALWYMSEVRVWMGTFKFKSAPSEAQAMAALVGAQVITYYRQESLRLPAYLVPVPMTKTAWAKRGYNQSELLAKALSAYLGIPILYALKRRRQSEKAHKLGAKGRKEVLQESFECCAALPKGTRIAIIDDVLTTGATLEAIASTLLQRGVIVDAWTVAYTPPPMLENERT